MVKLLSLVLACSFLFITPVFAQEAGLNKRCNPNGEPHCASGQTCVNHSGFHCEAGAPVVTQQPTPKPTATGVKSTATPKPTATVVAGDYDCDAVVSAAFTMTPSDVRTTVLNEDGFQYFRGCVARQVHIDAMEQYLLASMPELLRYSKSNPYCAGVEREAFNPDNGRIAGEHRSVLTLFGRSKPYNDILGPPRKTWRDKNGLDGGTYGAMRIFINHLHDCSLSDGGKWACAASGKLTPLVRTILEVEPQAGVCTDASAPPPIPRQRYEDNASLSGLGVATARCLAPEVDGFCRTVKVGPLSSNDSALLSAAHQAHADASDPNKTPVPGSVQASHRAFEATARTEEEHHFRRIDEFPTYADSVANGNPDGWTDAEVWEWKSLEDEFHMCWDGAEQQQDWGVSDRCGHSHTDMHICAAVSDDRIYIRPPCVIADDGTESYGENVGIFSSLEDCSAMTCRDYLNIRYPENAD